MSNLDRRLNELSCTLANGQAEITPAPPREIFRDLTALQEEFSEVECNLKRPTISVVTQEVTLEGVELGRFEIILDLRCLDEHQPYEVTALDPSPAASNADVTHPHVETGKLCEGEGRAAIRAALSQGDCSISSCSFDKSSAPTTPAVPTSGLKTGTAPTAMIAVDWCMRMIAARANDVSAISATIA